MMQFRFAKNLFAGGFASGAVPYADRYADDTSARIVLPVSINRGIPVHAVVDTGSPWCIINPDTADECDLLESAVPYHGENWVVRGVQYSVLTTRTSITIEATDGDLLEVDATVFIPTGKLGIVYVGPNFLGLAGFLDRMRYAVDPLQNAFYFGPAD